MSQKERVSEDAKMIMTDKYEKFKKWFTTNKFKAKKDHNWYDPAILFREFEDEYKTKRNQTIFLQVLSETDTVDRYRVHDWVKYNYSEIGEYIGEGYTDKPLRNDELVKILNLAEKQIKELEKQLLDFSKLANENDMTIDELYQYMKSYFDSRHENTYWNPEKLKR